MSSPCIKVHTIGRVAVWIISNPDTKNALSPEMYAQGTALVQAFANDASLGAAVLCGENGFFCAGGNLHRLQNNRQLDRSVQDASMTGLHQWIQAISDCTKPIIAAVDGAAAGAGFSLCLAADMLVASQAAKFVMAYVNVGLTPDGGATWHLPKKVSASIAFELLALGQAIDTQRLYDLGLVNAMTDTPPMPCTHNETPAVLAAIDIARRLSRGPSQAIASIKRLLKQSRNNDLNQQLDAERTAFIEQLHSSEGGIGIAAFLSKEQAKFHP